MEQVVILALIGLVILGPILWRNRQDARAEQALGVRARVHAALRQRFKGEPLMSIEVVAPARWRAGRVILSTPSGWEWLVEAAWDALMAEVPSSYELVVRPGSRPVPRLVPSTPAMPRAA
jgi:hypothetical protein